MEQILNCFEIQNRASDFLDGTLDPAEQQSIQDHLNQCKTCQKRFDHYQQIIAALKSHPRVSLPEDLQKLPFSTHTSKSRKIKLTLKHWGFIPWYLRTLIQSAMIVLFILIGISSAPKLRSIYENKIEKNLAEFRDGFTELSMALDRSDSSLPPLMDKKPSYAESHLPDQANQNVASGQDELSGENEEPEEPEEAAAPVDANLEESANLAGTYFLWRFNVTTVSQDELRPQVIRALTDLGVPKDTVGLGGLKVPGGIVFDLILPNSLALPIKEALTKIAPASKEGSSSASGEASASETFTWSRVKSKKKFPEGKTHIVIWLAQPHF